MNKKFDQELFDANDERGRNAVISYLSRQGLEVEDHPDEYDVDLVIKLGGVTTGFVEVEVRGNNMADYQTIHVPTRKERFFQGEIPTYFFSVTQNLNFAYYTMGKFITPCEKIEVKNKYESSGEYFFDVPKSHFLFTNLKQFIWYGEDSSQVINTLNIIRHKP